MAEAPRVTIMPEDNGPYYIQGNFTIVMPSGREIQIEGETWLCRCGGSSDKPFCDSTHERIGFQAVESPAAEAEAPGATEAAEGFEDVAAEGAVAEGELLGVAVAGHPVVLGRVAGQVYALDGICSHARALLADGELDGEIVMCPMHNSGFNIKTGAAIRLPAREPVACYPVQVENGRILVSRRPGSAAE